MFDELLRIVRAFFLTEYAPEDEGIEHVLIGDVYVLLDLPRLALAVGASVLVIGDDLIVQMAKDPLALLALLGVIQGDAVANGAGDQLVLQERLLPDPFLVNHYQLRLFDELLVGLDHVCALLHPIIIDKSSPFHPSIKLQKENEIRY
jgi:hypothetical protein